MIYFIGDGRGHVKIGYAKRNAEDRLCTLQTGAVSTLRILREIDGSRKIEGWLHRRFVEHRIRGEWFRLVDEMLTVIPPDEIPIPRQQHDYESRYDRNEITADERRRLRMQSKEIMEMLAEEAAELGLHLASGDQTK